MPEYITRMGYHLGGKFTENERKIGGIPAKIAVLFCRAMEISPLHCNLVWGPELPAVPLSYDSTVRDPWALWGEHGGRGGGRQHQSSLGKVFP